MIKFLSDYQSPYIHHSVNKREILFNDYTNSWRRYRGHLSDHVDTDHFPSSTYISPTEVAAKFYLLQHAIFEIQKEFSHDQALPFPVVQLMDEYISFVTLEATRMLHYLIAASIRESRHSDNEASIDDLRVLWEKHEKYSISHQECVKHKEPNTSVVTYMQVPNKGTLVENLKLLMDIFYLLKWRSAYGGKKWGKIAQSVHDWCIGKYSLETLMDTGFTLAHNGGPVFNKSNVLLRLQ